MIVVVLIATVLLAVYPLFLFQMVSFRVLSLPMRLFAPPLKRVLWVITVLVVFLILALLVHSAILLASPLLHAQVSVRLVSIVLRVLRRLICILALLVDMAAKWVFPIPLAPICVLRDSIVLLVRRTPPSLSVVIPLCTVPRDLLRHFLFLRNGVLVLSFLLLLPEVRSSSLILITFASTDRTILPSLLM